MVSVAKVCIRSTGTEDGYQSYAHKQKDDEKKRIIKGSFLDYIFFQFPPLSFAPLS